MGMHGDLFEGPMPPQTRTEPPWPGVRPAPARTATPTRFSFLALLLSR
ncbi:MAG: hypothetical protein ACT4QF_11600 [Sporichthyaceae bacterium]